MKSSNLRKSAVNLVACWIDSVGGRHMTANWRALRNGGEEKILIRMRGSLS